MRLTYVCIALSLLFFSPFARVAADQSGTEELQTEIEELKAQLEQLEEKFATMLREESAADASVEPDEAADPEGVEKKGLADYVDVYGSLNVRTGIDADGVVEVDDNVSMMGIAGELPLGSDRYSAFARFEVGIRMASSPNQLTFSADPGGGIGQDDDTITSRLGSAGIRTPFGQLSWGKQNSPFYDVASFTVDKAFVFGGDAAGAYNRGTDGGPSGTGRADKAAQYRLDLGPVVLGLQAQNRNSPENPNSRGFGDTIAGSLLYKGESGLALGIAYNEVRDGLDDPQDWHPAAGDTALIVGASFTGSRFYVASTWSQLDQHEVDDQGNLFDGDGIEVFGYHLIGDHLKVEGGWTYLDSDSPEAGDYRLNYAYSGLGYQFGEKKTGTVWIELRIDDSRGNDGSDIRNNLLAGGVIFGF